MPDFDLPLAGLRERHADDTTPDDFDAFWQDGIEAARALGGKLTAELVDTGLTTITTHDVTFPGYGGEPVRAWLHLPRHTDGPLPVVVRYIGYGGGRGLPYEDVLWASAGYAYFVMDARGQGSDWGLGDTVDPHGSGPAYPGFATRGIGDPEEYYYRRVTIDAVRAVDAVAALATEFVEVDASRISVVGTSQGGGLALAVAGLHPAVRAAMIDVPFLCDFPRAVHIAQRGPYTELAAYMRMHRGSVARVRQTLAYFDGISHARRAMAPALFSVALMDDICPPSTVFAAYNVYGGAKEIREYEFNNHEGGGSFHAGVQLRWLSALGQVISTASRSDSITGGGGRRVGETDC
ncbi:acetylxylan esterase [Catenulispora pinisilvae]|uniref:acetylxylan esterase n=1 Tax=Catenulispora pinisilvae TaxID=2705253 RepID=UPI001892805D|nr:acetylxylan esterase [Catenulispora pinisilvae]